MGRNAKIAVGIVAVLAVLLGVNALVTDAETESAEITVPGGRVLGLQGAAVQVVDRGPRGGSPIVLVHCFTCAIDWWDRMMPRLARDHRVVAVDLLGHGGSEKPESGYSVESQAELVAEALATLGVREATVVGHSLGGAVAVALAERSPWLVERLAILDSRPRHDEGDLGLVARLGFTPLIGEAGWRIKTDSLVREGLEVAFAPGFEVPDAFVEDVERMTYSAYDQSASASADFAEEESLDRRVRKSGKPLLVLMGAEEQIVDDPAAALAEYRATVPGARTRLLPGVGHSPNVEAPVRTAGLLLRFAAEESAANPHNRKETMQERMQERDAVRGRP